VIAGFDPFVQNFEVISNVNLLKPTGYVMHQQFNILQLYALPTLYLRGKGKGKAIPL
jgi:hypothetical protein